MSWLVAGHVRDGREHFNYSEWTSYDSDDQDKLLGGICSLTEARPDAAAVLPADPPRREAVAGGRDGALRLVRENAGYSPVRASMPPPVFVPAAVRA